MSAEKGYEPYNGRPGKETVRVYWLLPMLLCLIAGRSEGQELDRRLEVFGGAGVTHVGADEGSRGTGATFVGGVGLVVSPRVSIEGEAQQARHERSIAGGPLKGTSTGVFGDVVLHSAASRTALFVMGSAGVLNSKTTHVYPSSAGSTTTVRANDTGFAWGGGAGGRVFITPRVSLRAQLRVMFSESTGATGLMSATAVLGYHW